MYSFRDYYILTEGVKPIKMIKHGSYRYTADKSFTTKDKTAADLKIEFEESDWVDDVWDVAFWINSSTKNKNLFDTIKDMEILATIQATIDSFITQVKPGVLRFSVTDKIPMKLQLYKIWANRLAKKYGGDVEIKRESNQYKLQVKFKDRF